MSAGFLCFASLERVLINRKICYGVIFALSTFSLWAIVFAVSPAVIVAAVLTGLFFAGSVGACVYSAVSLNLRGNPCIGRICALRMGMVAILQILVFAFTLAAWMYALILTASLAVSFALLMMRRDFSPHFDKSEKSSDSMVVPLWLILMSVAVISVMGGLNDGVLTKLQTSGELNLYALPRLFYFVGMELSGWMYDRFRLRGLSMLVIIVMVFSTAGAMFMNSSVTVFLNATLYSLFAGIVIIYFTVPFFNTVTESNASLWASLGRAVRLPALALGVCTYEFVLSAQPFTVTVFVYVFLSAVLTALFAISGQLQAKSEKEASCAQNSGKVNQLPETSVKSDEELIAYISRLYQLTPKEQTVFGELVLTEDKQDMIAKRLNMSVNTLRHHITSIYRKMHVDTRTGLYKLYNEKR